MDTANRMRSLATTNLIMVFAGVWVFITFPLPFAPVYLDVETFWVLFSIFMIDFLVTISLVSSFQQHITDDIRRQFRILMWFWITISFLSRLFVAGYASYVVGGGIVPLIAPASIGLSSILFGIILLQVRNTKIALKAKWVILTLATINFFNGLFLTIFIGNLIVVNGFEIGYLLFLIVGGLIKGISYFLSGWLLMLWSFRILNLKDIQELYPEQAEGSFKPIENEEEADEAEEQELEDVLYPD